MLVGYETLNRLHLYHDTHVVKVLDDRRAIGPRRTANDGGGGMNRVKRVFLTKAVLYPMILEKKISKYKLRKIVHLTRSFAAR